MQDGRAVTYSTPSLIGSCVLIAAIAVLFTTRYPPDLFDSAVGIDWWGYQLLVYVASMTDQYSPFRLHKGQYRPQGPAQPLLRPASRSRNAAAPTVFTLRAGISQIRAGQRRRVSQ